MTKDLANEKSTHTNPVEGLRQAFTFVGDSNFTFVNYPSVDRLTYRQEARLHNAHRRVRKKENRLLPRSLTAATSSQAKPRLEPKGLQLPRHQLSRGDQVSLSLADLDLTRKSLLSNRFRLLEDVWRNVFHNHFFLPSTDMTCSAIEDPQLAFLSIARTSWRDYRNIVIQPVITSEAKRGQQAMDIIWRNQALILQDFRCLTEKFTGPGLVLTKDQFQQVFSAAFASIIHCIAFQKEEEYNAILEVNFALMATPQNRCVKQLPTMEWLRMLLPRPPESFDRSPAYQEEMFRKVELILDFVADVQATVAHSSYRQTPHSYDALIQIVNRGLLMDNVAEPYPGFYSVCLHRILFLLHIHLNEQNEGDDTFLITLNEVAKTCLKYPSPSYLTLFLWTFLHQSEARGECRDTREPYFHWAMRDLIAVYNLSFLDSLISWFLCRISNEHNRAANTPIFDIPNIRATLRAYYILVDYKPLSEIPAIGSSSGDAATQQLPGQLLENSTILKEEDIE